MSGSVALVDPIQQFLEVHIHGQRLRLIDEAEAGAKVKKEHRAALAVAIPGVGLNFGKESWVVNRTERLPYSGPIRDQPIQEFHADRHPLIETPNQFASQNWIFKENSEHISGRAKPGDKVREAIFSRFTRQIVLDASDMKLKYQSARQPAQQALQ
jgi:hypothetical protein